MFALAALAAAGVLAAFPPGAATRVTSSQTYSDPAGDSQGAPDITSLTISDSATGVVQFSFTVTGMGKNSAAMLWLDTDRNSATGDEGDDYVVDVELDSDGSPIYDIGRYDGSTWADVPQDNSMGMSVSGNVWTLRVGKAALGGTTGFAFWGGSLLWDANENVVAADRLPDGGELTYDLSPAVATPTTPTPPKTVVAPWIGAPTISPAPKAGKTVTVVFPVTDKTTGAPLRSGSMTCDPQVNGKVLVHQESFGNGAAKLRFTLPKTAKGKTLKVNMTIRVGAKSVHRVATFKIG